MVIDVGAGDGRFPYERARLDPASFYIGIDPDAESLKEYAYRASRKPSRGGIDNVAFVVASVEHLPAELDGLAAAVYINYPWGGLLRGLLLADPDVLSALARLAAPQGSMGIVLTYDPAHDLGAALEPLPSPGFDYIDQVLAPAYEKAGVKLTSRRLLTRDEALAIASTWGRRLLHGRERDVFLIEGLVQH